MIIFNSIDLVLRLKLIFKDLRKIEVVKKIWTPFKRLSGTMNGFLKNK